MNIVTDAKSQLTPEANLLAAYPTATGILTVDLDAVTPRVPSMISPVVITNASDFTVSECSDNPAAVLTVTAG